jgi:AcrR family transcriptional regulator
MVELVAQRGYRGITVRDLASLAGVSTATFYAHFENAEDCFASTCAWFLRDAFRRAAELPGDDAEAARVRVRALVETFADNPKAADLALVESFSVEAVRASLKRPTEGIDRLLLPAATSDPGSVDPPAGISEVIVDGTLGVARSRLLADDPGALRAVADEVGLWALALRDGDASAIHRSATPFFAVPEPDPDSDVRRPLPGEYERILTSAAKVAMSRGYEKLTIPKIRTEAGVTRQRFDETFDSVEDVFLAAVERLVVGAFDRARREVGSRGSWYTRVVETTVALCREVSRDPALARLAFIDVYAAGRRGVELIDQLILRLAAYLRREVAPTRRPSEVFATASVAAAWGVMEDQVKAGKSRQLADLAPTLAFILLAPIVGGERVGRHPAVEI